MIIRDVHTTKEAETHIDSGFDCSTGVDVEEDNGTCRAEAKV